MALTGTQKTNITAVETALTTAIGSLPSTSTDTAQAAASGFMRQMQSQMLHLKDIRNG